ncbi:MAG: GAF domain-containing protein [Chloroflexi bacterium]|nr:MAG: GAF domain-containing protein [Chloroflexota bacterium]
MTGSTDDNSKTLAASLDWRTLPGALLVYDLDGVLVDGNEAAFEILGADRDELIGSRAEQAGLLVTEAPGGPMSVHPVVAALKTRQPVRGVLGRVARPDGVNVWVQMDALPELVEGEVARVLTSLTDVTHLITHSHMSGRSPGDHIVEQVTEQMALARLDPAEILTTVTRTLSRLRPGSWVATLMRKDPSDLQIFVANEDGTPDRVNEYMDVMGQSPGAQPTPISQRVIESGQPLLLANVSADDLGAYLNDDVRAYLEIHPWIPKGRHVGVAVVPMRARGAIIGTLGLFERRSSNPLTEKDLIWIQAIADRAGLAVENAQHYEDAIQRLDRLTALQGVSLAISASPDLRLTLKVILDHVTAQLKVDAADVLLLDETDNSLVLSAGTGFQATAVLDYRLPADEGMPGQAITGRRIETVTALSAFSQFRRRSLFAREGFKSYGAVPLISRGRLLGALEVFQRSPLSPDQEWLSFLDALGSVAAVAIDNATMQERLRHVRGPDEPRRPARAAPQMSTVEKEILRLAVEGMTNREIAARVHLSQNTVKFHMRQILQRAGASNRTELAHQAAKEGWL